MTDKPIQKGLVDVVVLSWNRAESTITTLANILAQTGVRLKVWVIDQGSTRDVICCLTDFTGQHPSMEFIELGHNFGVSGGRNRGMALGNGEFIVCIDNDAEFASQDAIQTTIVRFRADEDLAVIGYKIKNYYTNIADRANWVYPRQLMANQDQEFNATRFCGAGHAIRRAALAATDYYDERLFFYWEELDLSYQFINLGYKVLYFPVVEVLHKVDPDQRVNWQGSRWYYLVRNALYLDWKYYRRMPRWLELAAGYLLKGTFNGFLGQTIKAIKDALIMGYELGNKKGLLNQRARQYIHENDVVYRGSFTERLKREVLERMD